ncbi:class I SAM-dependent methyltransferase [Aestuariimicrobium soli]|uniref:class I SAM-dependent methyltransferase n=1 Tax=Aestuariimicrobium soli TaxID=2035834 RepID=UPI003EBB7B98
MPDAKFADARLAPLYDTFEAGRVDLNAYLAMLREFARPGKAVVDRLLDVGCGTGTFALMAAAIGVKVTGVDPSAASVAVARGKAGADRVSWHVGTAPDAPAGPFDLAVMTGNVAQVFVDDADWLATLTEIRDRLSPDGRLVFETRRPEARAWERWGDPSEASATFPGEGLVRTRNLWVRPELPLVSFAGVYEFEDGTALESTSTLRFRDDAENRALLTKAGFTVDEVREAPDRPGLERVYVARVTD